MAEVRPECVPAVDRFGDPVGRFFLFLLKGPKHPVPDNQRTRMILDDLYRITAMVHAMVRGRIEDPFKPTHFVNGFGMNPELIKSIQGRHYSKSKSVTSPEA